MGNSLRCCLACVIPCGALDVIRIVHLNGYVEEMTRAITAEEVLKSYPNHVLTKPCSQAMVRKILILSPHSELKRGGIYFLIPHSSLPSHHSKIKSSNPSCNKIIKSHDQNDIIVDNNNVDTKHVSVDLCHLNQEKVVVVSKSKSKSRKHQRRRSSRSKSGIWQPHLQSITEDF